MTCNAISEFVARGSLALACALLAGCALKVIDLDPLGEIDPAGKVPFADIAMVEEIHGEPGRWDDAGPYQRGFRHAMRNAKLFHRVVAPDSLDFTPDLVVRGEVAGEFAYSGGLNFMTWFPGPFLLMHNWRGNRYEYATNAEIDLVDARTGEPIQHYRVEARHRLIHQSSSPFPIFGAALVFPGIIRGAQNARPRLLYRQELYDQAYADLWQKVIEEIRAERAPHYAARRKEKMDRCGADFNARPAVGHRWSDFVSCQDLGYYARGEHGTPDGVETLYSDGDALLEIFVIDGRIVRWQAVEPAERKGAPAR